ncbi:MAG TPA: DUF1810 domain-containing protein [Devosia sp.]|jgi:uncharacterized protein (DUF1810 family)|uniref:DUF1810 domain-containing protein n=1 Tax=Devosia sp. TaxID=1871048 RepID=UPI002DDCA2A1|nr:DUF1810 domain-containing protein [Devosia sp.]HEV2515555.1 DUF1810 domain-containing protein [Devosia sp.]
MFEHFVAAQDPVYAQVLAELSAGRKQTHWMWFIFPQLRALGRSAAALRFGIADLAEARAYLIHPVLGARLRECAGIVGGISGRTAHEIFGSPDDVKLRSSMTLFAHAAADAAPFRRVLERYYDGVEDAVTVGLIGR